MFLGLLLLPVRSWDVLVGFPKRVACQLTKDFRQHHHGQGNILFGQDEGWQ